MLNALRLEGIFVCGDKKAPNFERLGLFRQIIYEGWWLAVRRLFLTLNNGILLSNSTVNHACVNAFFLTRFSVVHEVR